ncbi:MAG TPA: DNA-3-methyladenine glycosylase I [Polyangiaceae bacterium]
MNAAWHAEHPLPRSADDSERLRWHRAHQKACGCRPIPARLLATAKSRIDERAPADKPRCHWATNITDPLYLRYHDEEWGVPSHDDRHLFEMLILEGAQAGLSWLTILRKRENYRRAFDRFDAKRIAQYDRKKFAALMADEGIVRNRLKIESTIDNARAFLAAQKEFGSFDAFIWSFVGGKPFVRLPQSLADVPARDHESDAMSKALKKRGFRFVGSTICYAFMQACGLVNDHASRCFRAPKAATASKRS